MKNEGIVVLGIDPGYERVGIAVVVQLPQEKKAHVLYSHCFITPKDIDLSGRILLIGDEVMKVIKEYSPIRLSIEKLYFTNNHKTAMGVAEARGVIINQAKQSNLAIDEFTPPEIKLAVAGYGKADKKAVWHMTKALADIKTEVKYDDEMDAIAIALTSLAFNR